MFFVLLSFFKNDRYIKRAVNDLKLFAFYMDNSFLISSQQ